MPREAKLPLFNCKPCGHEWVPRTGDPGLRPRCKSALWKRLKEESK